MVVQHLELASFRSYHHLSQEFSPGLNVLVGPNGNGKTNVVEALYLLATTRSLRGAREADLIRWDQSGATLRAELLTEQAGEVSLEMSLGRAEPRSLAVNGVRRRRLADFVGQLKAVVFSTADLEMVRGEPAGRRRFLDLEISQISPGYLLNLSCYRQVLEQRNRMLKNLGIGEPDPEAEAAWAEQLVHYGSRLVERRRDFLRELQTHAAAVHRQLTRDQETLTLAYRPSVPLPADPPEPGEELPQKFRAALGQVRLEERRRGVTLVGPHRDDLGFLINGRDARLYGSQGQQRTVALSVKMGELRLIRALVGEPPICLLDDVCSELDGYRRSSLFELSLEECQTFLTTTDIQLIPHDLLPRARVFEVRESRLTERDSSPDPS